MISSDFAPLTRERFRFAVTYLELSLTLPVVSLRYLATNLTAFSRKMDETKEKESMHLG